MDQNRKEVWIAMLHITKYLENIYWINIFVNVLGQNCCHFGDAIFKCIFLNQDISISINISLRFDCKVRINNAPALVQIMAWCLVWISDG